MGYLGPEPNNEQSISFHYYKYIIGHLGFRLVKNVMHPSLGNQLDLNNFAYLAATRDNQLNPRHLFNSSLEHN